MSNLLKYDILTLISLIESKPCLWDKTADCFKDKLEKRKAWKEVFTFLEKDFLQKNKNEQHKTGEAITGKWHNIRDSFVRSLRRKPGQTPKRKYLYHDNLAFLLKVVRSDNTKSNIENPQYDQDESQDEENADAEMEVQALKKMGVKSKETENTPKKPRLEEEVGKRIIENLPDEDEAFFMSIIPYVRKMSEEDKLEFRVNVLQLIRTVNGRKNNQPPQFSSLNAQSKQENSNITSPGQSTVISEDL